MMLFVFECGLDVFVFIFDVEFLFLEWFKFILRVVVLKSLELIKNSI